MIKVILQYDFCCLNHTLGKIFTTLLFLGDENRDQYTEHAVNFKADCIHFSNISIHRTITYVVAIN